MRYCAALAALAATGLLACSLLAGDRSETSLSLPAGLKEFKVPADNPWTDAKAELGKQLRVDVMAAELAAKLIAAAALSLRPVRDAADAVPDLFSAMGAWRN